MDVLQKERDAFLLYTLKNPPKNVNILLPPGAESVADLDISCAANPLPLYATASAKNNVEVDLRAVPLLCGAAAAPAPPAPPPASVKLGGSRYISGYISRLMNSYRLSRGAEEKHSARRSSGWSISALAGMKRREGPAEGAPPTDKSAAAAANRRWVPLPLEGNDSQTLAAYVATVGEKKDAPEWNPVKFPHVPTLEFFPLIDSSMLATLDEEDQVLIVYEHLLIVTRGTTASRLPDALSVLQGYRDIAGISEEQHKRSLGGVAPHGVSSEGLDLNVSFLERLAQSSSDEAFVMRVKKILCICREYPDFPNERVKYPLALRAFLYSGALEVLHRWKKKSEQQQETVREVIGALRSALCIPMALDPFCLFHSKIFAKSNTDCTNGAQREFLKAAAKAVNALPTRYLSSEPLTAETKYKFFVLQETFEACAAPMQLISGNVHDQVLLCLSALFVESCLSLPSEFLSVCVHVDGQAILPSTSSSNDFLLMLLMIFIEQSILSEFGAMKLVDKESPEHVLKPLYNIGMRPRVYCGLLSQSLKNVNALVLPGVAKAASHALALHWKGALSDNKVPVDFAEGIKALLRLLLQFTTINVIDDEEVCRVLAVSGSTVFKWIANNSTTYDKETNEEAEAKYLEVIEVLSAPKSPQSGECVLLPHTAYQTVDFIVRHLTLPRPPPLVPCPDELVRSRLRHTSHCLGGITAVVQGALQAPAPPADRPPDTAPAHLSYLHDYRALLGEAEGIRAAGPPPLDDLTLRLRCLARIQDEWHRTVKYSAEEYADVRLVTGAPPASFDDFLLDGGTGVLQNAVPTICAFAAVAIVHVELGELLDMFMRTDLGVYRRLKRDKKAVAERRHLVREFPDVTMEVILNKLSAVFSLHLGCLECEQMREELRVRTGQHLVAALYNIYLDGPGRFFAPEDWAGIAQDLDSVEAFLFPRRAGEDAGEKAEELRRRSVVLLDWLRQIVRYCFSQSSAALIEGSEGVPRLADLPDTSVTSPWCKYVVRRVLEHRKDKTAKWSITTKIFKLINDD